MLTNLEICKFKDWEVNINKINNLFNLFDECVNILEQNNIEYVVAGSIACVLISNKIYRNVKDLDFYIPDPFFSKQINVFLNKNFSYISTNFSRILFEKNQIPVEFHINVVNMNNIFMDSIKINYKNYLINCTPIQNVFLAKKILYPTYNRKKDLDDMEFYKST